MSPALLTCTQSFLVVLVFAIVTQCHPTVGFSSRLPLLVAPNRSRRSRLLTRASNKKDGDGDGDGDITPSFWDNLVKSVSDESNDLTQKLLSELSGKNLDSDSYQFGDISKNLASQVGQVVTGDEEYQFGDLTKSKLEELESELEAWRNQNLNGLPNNLFQQTFQNLSPLQRRDLIVGMIRLAAIALLSWGLISNMANAGVLSMAWTRTSLKLTRRQATIHLPLLPFQTSPEIWRAFLSSYTTLKIVLDPFLLVLKGCGTLFLFLPYERCIAKLEQTKWISSTTRKKYPLLFRAGALMSAFTLNNVLLPTAIAFLGLGLGGVSVRCCQGLFPPLGIV